MIERVGDYSFEERGEYNPYDRFFMAQRLIREPRRTLQLLKQLVENRDRDYIESGLVSAAAVFVEDLDDLLDEIRKRGLGVGDTVLQSYMEAETNGYTIDDQRYDPRSRIPLIHLLKIAGYTKEEVLELFDYSDSTLPPEHMGKVEDTLKLVEEIYEEE